MTVDNKNGLSHGTKMDFHMVLVNMLICYFHTTTHSVTQSVLVCVLNVDKTGKFSREIKSP